MRRLVVVVAALGLVAAGCTEHAHAPPPRGAERPRRTAIERPPTQPRQARVHFLGAGEPARRVRQAERDLKRVGLWDDLTSHLFEVKVAIRPGRSDIPSDRHLADAYPSAVAAPGGFGSLCDIVFYPAAISADLDRWRRYHADGVLAQMPPSTLRQYWGSILAHELGHCLAHGRGEIAARKWERRALRALGRSGTEPQT